MKILAIIIVVLITISCFYFCCSNSIYSQEKLAEWKTINTGTPGGYYTAAEDENGNIWFGTRSGPVFYDGNSFLQYDYPSQWVLSILIESPDRIWFATMHGLYIFDGDNFLLIENEFLDSLTSIEKIARDKDGSIWLGTWTGLLHFKNNEWIVYHGEEPWEGLSDSGIYGLFIDSIGNKWIGSGTPSLGEFLVQYNNKEWRLCTEEDGFPSNIGGTPNSFAEDSHGHLWITAWGNYHRILKYDGNKFHEVGPSFQASRCAIDKEGYVWFTGAGYGILLYNNDDWTHFTKDNTELSHDDYEMVFVDSNGNRWFGNWRSNILDVLTPGKVFKEESQTIENDNKAYLTISPNPSNNQTTIKYYIPDQGEVSVTIFNTLGQEVKTILNTTELSEGSYYSEWNGNDYLGNIVTSGVYFCVLTWNNDVSISKFTFLK